ncbi:hypothetical protein M011DRAFT_164909 [Sporormia fimetaria CBS 119925]|uniref:Uncharacterized protein n=1 Tax=Sporormia fimetaria CBS 119925 TaxID=1340428 RepID=A0A6A6V5X0_9PLEO|nr:hypothetical protein M011DRAFT_164909 [Sporormia fimetaria CBS 119925]
MARRMRLQHSIHDGAKGVVAMSSWLGHCTQRCGLSRWPVKRQFCGVRRPRPIGGSVKLSCSVFERPSQGARWKQLTKGAQPLENGPSIIACHRVIAIAEGFKGAPKSVARPKIAHWTAFSGPKVLCFQRFISSFANMPCYMNGASVQVSNEVGVTARQHLLERAWACQSLSAQCRCQWHESSAAAVENRHKSF